MSESAKTVIIKKVVEQGYTESFGALLHIVALMGPDPIELEPENEEESAVWRGHLSGLHSALRCLAMHERKVGPETVVLLVDEAIEYAADVLRHTGQEGAEG